MRYYRYVVQGYESEYDDGRLKDCTEMDFVLDRLDPERALELCREAAPHKYQRIARVIEYWPEVERPEAFTAPVPRVRVLRNGHLPALPAGELE